MTNVVHAMIDIETLGTSSDAAVMQVGVTMFDPMADSFGELLEGASREWNVTLQSSLFLGGRIDLETLAWWMRQPAATRDLMEHSGVSIRQVLDELAAWFAKFSPERVWSHGASFDIPILDGYYRRADIVCPWKYSSVRDTRTLFELAESLVGWKRELRPTAHTARTDAIDQATDVQLAMRALMIRTAGSSALTPTDGLPR